MTNYTITTTLNCSYDDAVQSVRDALSEQGFGILTEIDLKETLKKKLDVDIEPHIILGACRPTLAHEAIQAEPSIAAVLPCNVVVRSHGENSSIVEAFDPDVMMGFADNEALHKVAADAKQRINAAFATLANGN